MAMTASHDSDVRVIEKHLAPREVAPNLADSASAYATLSWSSARAELSGLPNNAGLNIAHEAVDRHAAGPRANHIALRWLGKSGDVRDFTYSDLARASSRFGSVLRSLGVAKGDRVFILADRVPELYIAALGTLKNGGVVCPLFSAFGPEPIRMRMTIGHGAVLVTTMALYQRKVASIRASLP